MQVLAKAQCASTRRNGLATVESWFRAAAPWCHHRASAGAQVPSVNGSRTERCNCLQQQAGAVPPLPSTTQLQHLKKLIHLQKSPSRTAWWRSSASRAAARCRSRNRCCASRFLRRASAALSASVSPPGAPCSQLRAALASKPSIRLQVRVALAQCFCRLVGLRQPAGGALQPIRATLASKASVRLQVRVLVRCFRSNSHQQPECVVTKIGNCSLLCPPNPSRPFVSFAGARSTK